VIGDDGSLFNRYIHLSENIYPILKCTKDFDGRYSWSEVNLDVKGIPYAEVGHVPGHFDINQSPSFWKKGRTILEAFTSGRDRILSEFENYMKKSRLEKTNK
jgi:hypothetical protein